MRKEKVYCDRCGKEVKYPFKVEHRVIKAKYVLVDIHDEYEDLCEDCSRSLKEWFKSKKDLPVSQWHHNPYNGMWYCGNCEREPHYDGNPMGYNYCPYCGRPMASTAIEEI